MHKELDDIIESLWTLCEQLRLINRIEHEQFITKSSFLLQSLDEIFEMYHELQYHNQYLSVQYEIYRFKFIELVEFIADMGAIITIANVQPLIDLLARSIIFRNQIIWNFP